MSIALSLVGGLVLLILAGDLLVRGAAALALRLGIPALIVSLTVVAFGTSSPELVISVQAALEGAPAIAIGNVVGSNIANVLLVLGIPALAAGLGRAEGDLRASFFIMLAATLATGALAWNGWLGRIEGLVLFLGLVAMILHAIHTANGNRNAVVAESRTPWPRVTIYLAAGLIGLPLGAHLLVDGAVKLARIYSISEEVIGLTLVAVGTSLPELATSVMAAIRRNFDVVIGNVIGSNIFNLLGILGVTAMISPLPVPPQIMAYDYWVMLGSALILMPFALWAMKLSRPVGAGLSALYAAYVLSLLA